MAFFFFFFFFFFLHIICHRYDQSPTFLYTLRSTGGSWPPCEPMCIELWRGQWYSLQEAIDRACEGDEYTLLKSDVTRRDHVVYCHGSQECWFTLCQFRCQFHSRRHSLRITLKSTTLVHMRSRYAWTRKSWQRSEWRLDLNSVLSNREFPNSTETWKHGIHSN